MSFSVLKSAYAWLIYKLLYISCFNLDVFCFVLTIVVVMVSFRKTELMWMTCLRLLKSRQETEMPMIKLIAYTGGLYDTSTLMEQRTGSLNVVELPCFCL